MVEENDAESGAARRLRLRARAALVNQEGEDLAYMRGEAALLLLDELEARYEGLREYIDACVPLAIATTAERLADEAGATRMIRNVARQRRVDAEAVWTDAPLPNADNPEAVVRLYSTLAAIAADYLDSLRHGGE